MVTEYCAGARHENANRMMGKVLGKGNFQIEKHALVRNSGCARHEEFSFNEFIAVVVIRTGVEVCDSQERLDVCSHM
jgi:hypothetical protein